MIINDEVLNEENSSFSSSFVSSDDVYILDDEEILLPDETLVESYTSSSIASNSDVTYYDENFMLKDLNEYTVTEACLLMLLGLAIIYTMFNIFFKRWF